MQENNGTDVILSIGSNLGDRKGNIEEAVRMLGGLEGTKVLKVSGMYETEPVGYEDQPYFLNICVLVNTMQSPMELLDSIHEIENILKNAEVIDDSDISTDKVSLGAYVTLQNTTTKEEYKYKLVGESEVDFKKKRISENSPVGKAIIGQKKGKTVSVSAPKGIIKYKIIKIEKNNG